MDITNIFNRKIENRLGITSTLSDLDLMFPNIRQEKIEYIYLLEDNIEKVAIAAKRYQKSVKLIVEFPRRLNIYDSTRSQDFAKAIGWMDTFMREVWPYVHGLSIRLGYIPSTLTRGQALNTLMNLYLKRWKELFERTDQQLYLSSAEGGFLNAEISALIREKNIPENTKMMFDLSEGFRVDTKVLEASNAAPNMFRSIMRDVELVIASGVTETGKKTRVSECFHYRKETYLKFYTEIRNKIIIADGGDNTIENMTEHHRMTSILQDKRKK